MTSATHTRPSDADLAAIAEFPALAEALRAAVETCQRLAAAGYPSADHLLCDLTGGEALPEMDAYVEEVAEGVRIALAIGWDLGADRWWHRRVYCQETIDNARAELSHDPPDLAAFESFHREFEAAYPDLAQALSVAVDQIHNKYFEQVGNAALAELLPALEAALTKLATDRRLAKV